MELDTNITLFGTKELDACFIFSDELIMCVIVTLNMVELEQSYVY